MTIDRVEINPDVMLGKPVIRGTRIPVESILRKLAEGAADAELLDSYPRLTKADTASAIGCGARFSSTAPERRTTAGSSPA